MHLSKGNNWKGKGGVRRVRGVQYTANLGQEWTRIHATTQRRDFQVSRRGISNKQGRDFQVVKGLPKRGCGHAPQCIHILC
jgi:hypothetical protein